jgi:hypothetical protein
MVLPEGFEEWSDETLASVEAKTLAYLNRIKSEKDVRLAREAKRQKDRAEESQSEERWYAFGTGVVLGSTLTFAISATLYALLR